MLHVSQTIRYDAVGGMTMNSSCMEKKLSGATDSKEDGALRTSRVSQFYTGGVKAAQCADEMDNALARSQLLVIRKTRGAVSALRMCLCWFRDVVRLLLFLPLWCFGSEGMARGGSGLSAEFLYWSELVTSNEKQPARVSSVIACGSYSA